MGRQIEIATDVFHLIWSNWREGDVDENSILKRLLSPSGAETNSVPSNRKEENKYKEESTTDRIEIAKRPELGKMRWVDDVLHAFRVLGGKADLLAVYPLVEKIRHAAGRSTVRSLEATVRQTIEAHSSDSRNFKPGNGDYFRHVSRGRWALR